MSYSPEQVEAMADNLVGYMNTPAAPMLRAYAATLRQQAARVDEVEAREVVAAMEDAARRLYVIAETPEDNAASEVLLQAIPVVQAALSTQPAERQGEAVAWLCDALDGSNCDAVTSAHARDTYARAGRKITPLYTHPAAPVGVPDGMVLVPAEVGDSDAFMVLYEYQRPCCTRKDAYRVAIRKLAERAKEMLAAAPSAPQGVE